jgi:hypothetical protein
MSGHIRVKNFEKFQHYKDRNPRWIKLYNELLDDYAFGRLQDASKWLAVGIWLLASRYDNAVPNDAAWIARKINATGPIDLDALVSAGFIEVYQDASGVLADCSVSAMPEREREREEERDTGTSYPASPDEDTEHRRLKGEAAALIREHLWCGTQPPRDAPKGWTMGRDLTIWQQHAERHGPAAVNGALTTMRETLGISAPVTMRLFNVAGRADRMEQCIGAWRKAQAAAREVPTGPRQFALIVGSAA